MGVREESLQTAADTIYIVVIFCCWPWFCHFVHQVISRHSYSGFSQKNTNNKLVEQWKTGTWTELWLMKHLFGGSVYRNCNKVQFAAVTFNSSCVLGWFLISFEGL